VFQAAASASAAAGLAWRANTTKGNARSMALRVGAEVERAARMQGFDDSSTDNSGNGIGVNQ
jgi:hypothetical protein